VPTKPPGARTAPQPPTAAKGATFAEALPNALIVALITLSYALSYAALIFGPAPPEAQARGLWTILVSLVVLAGFGVATIRQPHLLVTLESTPLVALAGGTASLAAALAGSPPAVAGATIIAWTVLTSLAGGIAMAGLGQFRWATLARFVPLQVVAGVSAASGTSLVIGGAGVALARPALLAEMNEAAAWTHLAPALAMGGLFIAVTRLFPGRFTLPALIPAAILLHHALFAAIGIPLADQQAAGWLLHPPAHLRPELPWTGDILRSIDWAALARHVPAAVAVIAIGLLSTLMTLTSIELAARQELDVDRDMRAIGLASIASAMCGGLFGSVSQSRTLLLKGRGGGNRLATLLCAAIAATVPMLVPAAAGLVPRTVLAALLIYVGFGLLDMWLFRIRKRLTRLEWLTVPAVILVTLYFGLAVAVFVGMALGCATFALVYGQGAPVRAGYQGDIARSHVERSPAEDAALAAHADTLLVLHVQGFMFFGSATRLRQRIRAEIDAPGGARLRHVVLECSGIDGLDGSAIATFERLLQIMGDHGMDLTLAGVPRKARQRLEASLPGKLSFAETLDQALEAREAAVLAGLGPGRDDAALPLAQGFRDAADHAAFLAALQERTVAQGANLMTQHEVSDDLMFLQAGRADIVIKGPDGAPVRLRQYGPGTMLGEIGFLQGTPRTATVVAATPCTVRVLTRDALARLQRERPSAAAAVHRALTAHLVNRLLDKDRQVATLLRGAR
jgi:SulP family sulfate permease